MEVLKFQQAKGLFKLSWTPSMLTVICSAHNTMLHSDCYEENRNCIEEKQLRFLFGYILVANIGLLVGDLFYALHSIL